MSDEKGPFEEAYQELRPAEEASYSRTDRELAMPSATLATVKRVIRTGEKRICTSRKGGSMIEQALHIGKRAGEYAYGSM